jgi:hypothetical protein
LAAAWGDYDNDGDLNLLLSGRGDQGGQETTIFPGLSRALALERITSPFRRLIRAGGD